MIRSHSRSAAALTAAAVLSISPDVEACPQPTVAATLCGSLCCGSADAPHTPSDVPPLYNALLSTGAPPSLTARGGDPYEVLMFDSFFAPAKMTIRPSSFVRWFNAGKDFHTATRDGMFDSGLVSPGDQWDFEFQPVTAGFYYTYTCFLHFGMDGTIYVARYGDANLDNEVNLADFNIMAANYGQSGPGWEGGDFNEDGVVNLSDYNLLAANYGLDIEPASLALTFGLIPEPAALGLLLPAAMLLRRRE